MASPGAANLARISPMLQRVGKNSDMLIAALLVAIMAMLIVPLPDWLLDTMLVLNITGSVTVLIVALYTTEPLEFSIFPSLLLIMTLFRLSLDVAATKLILSSGQAGQVIEAFGKFVIGGNYIVGIIAFLILIVVQFVVITNGAGRVAEVAARFTLDAMPGKQMGIDADLNAGLINEEQAKARRKKVQSEADFYGAMDGASKFVRGDAIAAILIIIINVVGGFAMGLSRGGDVMSVLQTYTLLTIGEGLVSQIPALLISTATGLIVTRAGNDKTLGHDFIGQLLGRPRPLMIVSGLLLFLTLLPGFPKLQLLLASAAMGAGAYFLMKKEKEVNLVKQQQLEMESRTRALPATGPESVMPLLGVETVELELGSNLVVLALAEEGGDLAERVTNIRKQIALELGIILPTVRIRDNLQLKSTQYQIKIRGAVVAQHELLPHCIMALDSGVVQTPIQGTPTTEPALGTPALWIQRSLKERAEMAGYITVECSTVLVTHLTEVIKQNAAEMLTRQETQKLIDHVKRTDAAAVDELLPNVLTLGEVQKVMQCLLRERVGVRDLTTILETLADQGPRTRDLDALTEFVRGALSRQICRTLQSEDGILHVITLAPSLEQELRSSIQNTPSGLMLAIDTRMAQSMIEGMSRLLEDGMDQGYVPVLVCSGQIRLPIRRLIERSLPALPVIAYTEIVPGVEVEAIGAVEAEVSLAK